MIAPYKAELLDLMIVRSLMGTASGVVLAIGVLLFVQEIN